ncbi:MAG: hypothetical protein ACFFB5_06220 [Promethearchaeota archaeon]
MSREFLEIFEEKLNFRSQSTDSRMVSVDFFLTHILPQVQVITVHSPFVPSRKGELGGPLRILTIPKTFDETWFVGGRNVTPQVPCAVVFYGIGFPSDRYDSSPDEDQIADLYYQSMWLSSREDEYPTIPKDEVFRAIRESQRGLRQRLKCHDMSVEEIVTSMSRGFCDGWLDILETLMAQIVETGAREAQKFSPNKELSYLLAPENEELYWGPTMDEFEYYYLSFLDWDASSDFKNGWVTALRRQRQNYKRVALDREVLMVDYLKSLIRDIMTIKRAFGGHALCPEFLTRGYLQAEPLLITLVFDDSDRPDPTEYLRQFEGKLNFQSLSGEQKKVSTDVFVNHILPQVVILLTDFTRDEDGTKYRDIVTIGKEEYEDLLQGKLRDTITFQWAIFDRKTDSLRYYISNLSDHICRMADYGFNLVEAKKISNIIQSQTEEN